MRFLFTRRENVHDVQTEHDEHISDESAMTSPPEHFGTHHHRSPTAREHQQLKQAIRELLRVHVVRVRTECGVSPPGVPRRRRGAPPASEPWYPAVIYLSSGQGA